MLPLFKATTRALNAGWFNSATGGRRWGRQSTEARQSRSQRRSAAMLRSTSWMPPGITDACPLIGNLYFFAEPCSLVHGGAVTPLLRN